MSMQKVPLPVDLNDLPERPAPGPIGGHSIGHASFVPKKHRLDESMARAIAEINSTKAVEIPPAIVGLQGVTNELNSLLLASAESMVTEAQNLLEQTKLWVEKLNQEIAAKVNEHAALTERLQTFGKTVLEAHNKYHNNQEPTT